MLVQYAARRLLQLIPVLLLVTFGVFLLVTLIPGDPVLTMLGVDSQEGARYSEQQYQAVRQQLGLDQPLPLRYAAWLGRLVQGDLGSSVQTGRPVLQTLLSRYPATVQLAAVAFILALCIAVPAGIVAAVRQNSRTDYTVMGFAITGVAIPDFWLALILIVLFSLNLSWLPAIGYVSPLQDPLAFLRHAIMPALVLGLAMAAQLTRYLRAEMLEQLHQDYVRTARAKGIAGRTVVLTHVVRNSLITMVTVAGLLGARLLGGRLRH